MKTVKVLISLEDEYNYLKTNLLSKQDIYRDVSTDAIHSLTANIFFFLVDAILDKTKEYKFFISSAVDLLVKDGWNKIEAINLCEIFVSFVVNKLTMIIPILSNDSKNVKYEYSYINKNDILVTLKP